MLVEWIDRVIELLKAPLSADEARDGWTQQLKQDYVAPYERLRAQVLGGGPVPYFGVVRSLDGFGLGEGPLYEELVRVANEANSLSGH